MYKLIEIIKKNLRLLVRSRSSALIVLFGPLVLILLISMAFNTSSLYDIKIGTYSASYSELSNSIIDQLNQDEFNVIRVDSQENCINSIKSNDIHVCAVFPENLNINTGENIEFYVDKSRINLVYLIINSISTKISIKSEELSTSMTSALVNSINVADKKINKMSGVVEKISVDLKDVKSNIDVIENNLLNSTVNKSSLDDRVSSMNLTGVEGGIIADYKKLTSDLISNVESSNSSLNAASSKLDTQIENVKDVKKDLSQVTTQFSSIQIKEVSKIVSPITTEIKPVSLESTHFNYTFPALLVIILLFSGLLVSSTTILEEKISKAFFRNFITPTSNTLFIIGNYLSNLFIVLIQVIVIFVVVRIFSDAAVSKDIIANLFVIIVLTASVFILLGMLIGYLFKSGETANLAVMSLACILLFFSNTILPLETLPTAIRSIANYNPFILGVDALKEILLFKAPLTAVSTQFYTLLIYFGILIVLVHLVRALSKRRYVEF